MQQTPPRTTRDCGIDLLRVLAMLMIILHHMLTHGGLLFAFPEGSATEALMYLLEAAICCAVNVYALISGYVQARFRLYKLLLLWIQVLFWSVALNVLLLPLGPLPAGEWARAFTPVLSDRYWYFTAYFVLLLLLPLIHRVFGRLNRTGAQIVLAVCVLLFSVLPFCLGTDLWRLKDGYHPLWIILLYVMGFCLRRAARERAPRRLLSLLLYALCVLLSWGAWLLLHRGRGGALAVNMLMKYVSPTVVLCAFALVGAARGLHLPARPARVVSALSPLTFGVYLIHDHPMVRQRLMYMRFASFNQLGTPVLLMAIAGSVAAVFAACALMEWLRGKLFALLRVDAGCAWLEAKARKLWKTQKA